MQVSPPAAPLLSVRQRCYLQQHLQALLLPQPPHHPQQQQQPALPLPHQWVLLQPLPLPLSDCIAAAAC
jgi:hypothetical protein